MKRERKVSIEFRLDADLLKWLEKEIRKGHFDSVSDGIRTCIRFFKEGTLLGEDKPVE